MLKHRCAKASQRKSLWERVHTPEQDQPSWGWRLSSSWGKPARRQDDCNELPKQKDAEDQRLDPWYSELQSSQEIFRRKMAEIRRRVDEDPFRAVFGRRLDRACMDWSFLNWGLAKKAEREVGVVEGSPARKQPQSGPTEKAGDNSKSARQSVGGNLDHVNQPHAKVLRSDATRAKAVAHLEPTAKPKGTKTGNNSSLSPLPTTEEFTIDLITLRKVPRTAEHHIQSDEEPTKIPVKKFAGYRSEPKKLDNVVEVHGAQDVLDVELSKYKAHSVNAQSVSSREIRTDPVEDGLEDYEVRVSNDFKSPENLGSAETVPGQESSRSQSHRTGTKLPVRDFAKSVVTPPRSRSQPPQIESSLSRRLRNKLKRGSKVQPEENRGLNYNEDDSTVEDIDLLRASDVRAASGLAGRPRKETDEEKQQRRRELEDDFNKPRELETQITENSAAQTVANLKGIGSQDATDQETDAFGYDLTPQGLETSYERELQSRVQCSENSYAAQVEKEEAAMRDAEIDGFDKRPRSLETNFVRGQESQKSEGQWLGEVAGHDAWSETSDIDAVAKSPQELGASSPPEQSTRSSQTVESQDGGLSRIGGNNLDSTAQTPQSLPVGKIHQPRGEGDMSANVHDFAVRDRWYKKQAPQAMKKNATIVPEGHTSAEGLRKTFDGHRASYGNFQQENDMFTEDESNDAGVERGLDAYDSKLGRQGYHFHTGQDSLEADILAQSEQQIQKRVEDENVAPYISYSNPEALAMRWEEEEQKLHEEIRETNDILSEARAELSKIMASKEKSEPVDGRGLKASEPMKPSGQSAHRSAGPNAKAYEEDEKAALLKDGRSVLYRILAHDVRTGQVVTVAASSSTISATETPISLPKAISGLANPAPFLPHLHELDATGYEVVSGGHDVLVFRKVSGLEGPDPVVYPETESAFADRPRAMNPIDGTTTQTGNFASPTGFVNHDVVFPPPSSEQAPASPRAVSSRTGGRVRREEDVFSGSSRRWQDDDNNDRRERPRGRVRKVAKRVFWVGVWTAGCFYAVGVVAEFFRTGGADGIGAQGF